MNDKTLSSSSRAHKNTNFISLLLNSYEEIRGTLGKVVLFFNKRLSLI